MLTPAAQKLKIREGSTLLEIHAPASFKKQLQPLPDNVQISAKAKKYNQVHWFVENKARMEKELPGILPLIKEDIVCRIYYPKGTSKIQTDLTRDKGCDSLLKHDDSLTWISLISFDEVWSVFGCSLKTRADWNKADLNKEHPIFEYIDASGKTIRLPDDLTAALNKDKKAQSFFNGLSFTKRKEYVEWIVTAKKEETRSGRVKATVEKLTNGWKNPSSQ
ncbi:MAG: YdeI/OmpD-associated family protein [Ginsengibacter sp.]